jgi:hypothetical protein
LRDCERARERKTKRGRKSKREIDTQRERDREKERKIGRAKGETEIPPCGHRSETGLVNEE